MWIIGEADEAGEIVAWLASRRVGKDASGHEVLVPQWTQNPDDAALYPFENDARRVCCDLQITMKLAGDPTQYHVYEIDPH
jgi:hypothetical protein